ncbi:MAG: ABC-type molybdenum transport system ATPase subunit/photorepair protein PhrA [Glaciecola sp.]|jgi:ABC-type molybdenum transport system ATPase subunit/photorepair protein PhrA
MGVEKQTTTSFYALSFGEQRLALIARAMSPPRVIDFRQAL